MPFECIPFSEHNPDLSRMLRPDFPGTAASRTQVRRSPDDGPFKTLLPFNLAPRQNGDVSFVGKPFVLAFSPQLPSRLPPPPPPPVPRARETRRLRDLFGYERMRWRLRSLSPSFLSFFLLFPCFLSFLLFFLFHSLGRFIPKRDPRRLSNGSGAAARRDVKDRRKPRWVARNGGGPQGTGRRGGQNGQTYG